MMQWAVSKFRVSTQIESILDQAASGMQQQLMQPKQPPQPAPDVMVKAQIEQEKIQSNERIAAMEAAKDKEIAALKATVDLQKVEMQAKFDQMAAQFDQVQQMMGMVQKTNPVMQLDGLAGAVQDLSNRTAEGQSAQMQQMQSLMERISKPRKRVPVRDGNGDIVEVREVEEDDNPAFVGSANLPPAMPAMPALGGLPSA
jgi:hypothetical protein